MHPGYPKMLYRRGGSEMIHGVEAEHCTVDSPHEEEAARGEGWGTYGEAIIGEAKAPPVASPTDAADLQAAAELLAEVETERDQLRDRVADLQTELAEARATIAAFDHDGDGKPGGRKKLTVKEPANG